MARQDGHLKMIGTIDELSYYHDKKNGHMVRRKGGVSAERFHSDPKFANSRRTSNEFGLMSSTAKIFRSKMGFMLKSFSDSNTVNRVNSLFARIKKADSVSPWGKRQFQTVNSSMLTGFEFNESHSLSTIFMGQLSLDYDRESAEATLTIPPFNPQHVVKAPINASHMQFVFMGIDLDLETEGRTTAEVYSKFIPLAGTFEGECLSVTVPAGDEFAVAGLVGVRFVRQLSEQMYESTDKDYRALQVSKVFPADQNESSSTTDSASN